MTQGFDAPWSLAGECAIGWLRRPRGLELPSGLRPLPGPAFVIAERYTASPVGRYTGFAVAVPARLGLRPGLCFVAMVVDSNDRRVSGRMNWGLPGEVGTLRWSADGKGVRLSWEEREISVTSSSRGAPFPMLVPMRALQHRTDGPVVVPFRSLGLARFAHIDVSVPDDDEFNWLAGRHGGVRISGLRLRINPARLPSGLLWSLRAPATAVEPGVSFEPAAFSEPPARYDDGSPRALGSVG